MLKELKNRRIISRKVVAGRPPRVEYSLTGKERGHSTPFRYGG
jgi:DNA-binding HxlR family transcriptional regulator